MDDDGKPIAKTKKKAIFEDEGLEAARDIFGCDFDYGEFEQYEGQCCEKFFTLIYGLRDVPRL